MADFGVKLNTRALKAIQERLLGAPLREKLTQALTGVAKGVETTAEREWPVERSPRTGLELSGPAYQAQARKKGHSVAEHSAALFGIRIDQRPFGVAVVLIMMLRPEGVITRTLIERWSGSRKAQVPT